MHRVKRSKGDPDAVDLDPDGEAVEAEAEAVGTSA
jgi:hypothetical protein